MVRYSNCDPACVSSLRSLSAPALVFGRQCKNGSCIMVYNRNTLERSYRSIRMRKDKIDVVVIRGLNTPESGVEQHGRLSQWQAGKRQLQRETQYNTIYINLNTCKTTILFFRGATYVGKRKMHGNDNLLTISWSEERLPERGNVLHPSSCQLLGEGWVGRQRVCTWGLQLGWLHFIPRGEGAQLFLIVFVFLYV